MTKGELKRLKTGLESMLIGVLPSTDDQHRNVSSFTIAQWGLGLAVISLVVGIVTSSATIILARKANVLADTAVFLAKKADTSRILVDSITRMISNQRKELTSLGTAIELLARQTQLLTKETASMDKQTAGISEQVSIQRSSANAKLAYDSMELRTVVAAFDQLHTDRYFQYEYDPEARSENIDVKYIEALKLLLDKNINNAVLIHNDSLLQEWTNAQESIVEFSNQGKSKVNRTPMMMRALHDNYKQAVGKAERLFFRLAELVRLRKMP